MPSSPGQRHTPVALHHPSCPPDDIRHSPSATDPHHPAARLLPSLALDFAAFAGTSPSSQGADTDQDRDPDSDDALVPAPSAPQDCRYDFGRVWQNFPYDSMTRQSATPSSSFLRPGSKFRGTQESDRQVYNVQVEIKHVDMDQSFVCGYLRIQGLTDDHPTLTTYFQGEMIGSRYSFVTQHPEWGSSEKVDLQHWARFPAWRPLRNQARSPTFTYKNFAQREHLFMRWKEYFLVPDHRVKTISGASFEGFYYICFNQCNGTVSGIYFHAKSEKYQQLELYHVNDYGCTGLVQLR